MKYMHALFDQLDQAGKHLHENTAAHNRFALILVDNAVELMVHHTATLEVRWRSKFPIPERPALPPSKRKKVLGQHLDAKTAFCQEMGWITEAERKFIGACHEYRNELYHIGIRHEPIIHALAWAYHNFACELVARDQGPIVSSSTDEPASPVVLKHTDGKGVHTHEPAERKRWSDSLKKVKPPLAIPLSAVLTDYAKGLTDELANALEFLLDNGNPDELGADHFLKRLEHWNEVTRRVVDAEDKGQPITTSAQHRELAQAIQKDWKPKFNLNPIPNWQKRVEKIAQADDPIEATLVYSQLRGDMAYLEEILLASAAGLDAELDAQFEDMRLGM